MPDPQHSSAEMRTSRELSGRVEQDFHKRPDPFRRWNRWLSGGACAAVVVWIGATAATGRRSIYEAGPVAPSHQFFENSCQTCHTTWAPAARFKALVGDFGPVHSVDDAGCKQCHAGSPHFAGQDPPHDGLGCAACHREHRHDASLTSASNSRCIECHRSLEERLAEVATSPDSLSREKPATRITSFSTDHPQFDALKKRDATRLAFNHSVHLRHEYDKDGTLVKGIQNKQGQLEDLSKNCAACHEPDANGRYMEPVRYAQHCQSCHPLYYDNVSFPGEIAPHGVSTATLRGFLIERYTMLALREAALVKPPSPSRSLPGRVPGENSLTAVERRRVRESAANADDQLMAQVAASEEAAREAALRREKVLFGPEALGGCRLCHEVSDLSAVRDRRGFLGEWEIVRPNIPPRWLERSRFSHDSHRIVACVACHEDSTFDPPRSVLESSATSDVLIPSIDSCRSCHSEQANIVLPGGAASGRGVASRCIDCHDYHRRDNESTSEPLIVDLQVRSTAEKPGGPAGTATP